MRAIPSNLAVRIQRGEIFRRTSLFPDRRRRPGGISLLSFSRKNAFRDYQDHKRNASKIAGDRGRAGLHPAPPADPGTVLTVACEAEKVIVESLTRCWQGKGPSSCPALCSATRPAR